MHFYFSLLTALIFLPFEQRGLHFHFALDPADMLWVLGMGKGKGAVWGGKCYNPNPLNPSPWTHTATLGTFCTQWSELLEHEISPDASNILIWLLSPCMSWPFLVSPPAPHHYAFFTSGRLNTFHDFQHTAHSLSHLWASKIWLLF